MYPHFLLFLEKPVLLFIMQIDNPSETITWISKYLLQTVDIWICIIIIGHADTLKYDPDATYTRPFQN